MFAVVREKRFLGLISSSDIQRIMNEPALAEAVIAADMMREPQSLLHPDENVYKALNGFRQGTDGVLPVVERGSSRRWLGVLTREGVFKAVIDTVMPMAEVASAHRRIAARSQFGKIVLTP